MSYPPQPTPPQWYYGAPPPRQPLGPSPAGILVLFIGVLLVLSFVAAVVILLSLPSAPEAPCEPGKACAPQPSLPPVSNGSPTATAQASRLPVGSPTATTPTSSFVPPATPTSDSPVLLSGEVWRSATLNYSFEYDPDVFQVFQSTDELANFNVSFSDAQVLVVGASGDVSPSELIQQELTGDIDRFMIGRTADRDPYDAVLGPSIGYVNGEGSVWTGTMLGSDGTPVAPGGVTIVAATDGRITAAVIVIVVQPDVLRGSDTVQHAVRKAADTFLNTFDWDSST